MEYHFSAVSSANKGRITLVLVLVILGTVVIGGMHYFSPRFALLSTATKSVRLSVGSSVLANIKVSVENTSFEVFSSKKREYLSTRVFGPENEENAVKLEGVDLGELAPGQVRSYNMVIPKPSKPGNYKLVFDLIKEGAYWFSEVGNFPLVIQLVVE